MMTAILKKQDAMTLTELLISSILVGVVITGAMSADFAVRTWQKRIEHRTMAQMDLARALEQITKDVKSVIGRGAESYAAPSLPFTRAIHYRSDSANKIFQLCLRQDPDITVAGDEYYVVYEYPNWASAARICRYEWPAQDMSSPKTNYDGSLLAVPDQAEFFKINLDGTTLESIEITLTTRPDPSQSVDPQKNPAFSLTTTLMPTGISQ